MRFRNPSEVTNWLETCGYSNIIDQGNKKPEVACSYHTFDNISLLVLAEDLLLDLAMIKA